MKHVAMILCMALAAMSLLSSCASSSGGKEAQVAQLTQWANIAITAAELGGQLNPKQAAAIRTGGKLLLDLSQGKDVDLAALSSEAVAFAVAEGKLTPEQAAALQAAGTVPLQIASPAATPVVP